MCNVSGRFSFSLGLQLGVCKGEGEGKVSLLVA